ncbi:helix-turn-helix domain-containing protein [Lysinibacillus piscis]|uniref:HTH luxR-type domain-containing protein n=1 Tax=Lysinibacillus piscis TaxID=2518931 RepID=A0ABQ5NNX0_9BACI|nr:helix-turn-helix domain-containing protein [Lysinibacillus sp. KH24]GLC90055.1 hypothetical protein LYSBPC_31820 [Lysinibacillus sp. KH24]
MQYLTTAEIAEKWSVSIRQVQRLLAEGRIPNAQKYGRSWMIPSNAEKPTNLGREKRLPQDLFSSDLLHMVAATSIPMPIHNPDAILNTINDIQVRYVYEAHLAYLRGNFQQTLECYHQTKGDDAARLCISSIAIAAANTLGDYATYIEIETFLKSYIKDSTNASVIAIAELALSVSSITSNVVPDWIKKGAFDALPSGLKPSALYLRARYFYSINQFDAMLAVAQTTLTLNTSKQGVTFMDIYLRLACSMACYASKQEEDAIHWLVDTMHIALPHSFITPFADRVTALGGLLERHLLLEFPQSYETIIAQWNCTWKNWVIFHNRFAQDNLTLILSRREHHIAQLVARRVPYTNIAKQHSISVGRLKNIVLEIYEKLGISNRDELSKYVLWSKKT